MCPAAWTSLENVIWTFSARRLARDGVLTNQILTLNEKSSAQRCQLGCRTPDQPDYRMQQIKVILPPPQIPDGMTLPTTSVVYT